MKNSGLILLFLLLAGCSKKSMHQLFDFGKEKDVYLQLDLDLKIPGFEEILADSPGEEYALQAYLIRQGQEELLVNMRYKGGSSAVSLPVVLAGFEQSVNTILEVPLSEPVDANLGTWVFRFTLQPTGTTALRLAEEGSSLTFSTIETKITRGNNVAAINYRSTVVANIVDAAAVSTIDANLTADKLAATLESIDAKVKDKLASISAPVVKDTVSSRFAAGKMTDILAPVLRYIEYTIATDTALQDEITPVITEKTGVATSEVLSRYTSNFIGTSVSRMTEVVNDSKYSSMKDVITSSYISTASIPTSGETLTTTWTPKAVAFTDTLRTTDIAGTISITNPTNTTGLYGFAIYAGGSASADARGHYLGIVAIGTGAATNFSLPATTLGTGETTFWVFPVVDVADTSRTHGKQEINSAASKTIVNTTIQCTAGQYLSNGACADVGIGYWSDGTTDQRTACTNGTYGTYTDAKATTASCAVTCNATFTKVNGSCVCPAGKYASSGSCATVSTGYWSGGTGVTQTACSNKPAYSTYSATANTSATCAFTCNASFNLSSGSCVCPSGYTIVSNLCNGPPVALSGQTGVGYAYQSSQLGGLTFTRYGHEDTPGNAVKHDELMDFVDDPIGNSDGYRADGTLAKREYWDPENSSTPGWTQSDYDEKYHDNSGYITPYPGVDSFGDTYQGYFVPPLDGIYRFQNTVRPDNSVRVMMAPNECPNSAIAVISTDYFGESTRSGSLRTYGAADGTSIWVNGNGGSFASYGGQTNNVYNHNTAVFFPNGSSDTDYVNGDVYLLAGKIYYLEIRYAEGGGANAFAFGYARKDIGTGSFGSVQLLLGTDLLPFGGSDKYVPRQACAGTYDATAFFSDPDSDTLTYAARLVASNGSALSGNAALVSAIGLSFNTTTGALTGTLNGSYSGQKVIFSAKDAAGTNTSVDSTTITFIPNKVCGAGQYFTSSYCSNVGLGYWSDGTTNTRSACTNSPPANASFDDMAATTTTCSWACDNGYTLNNGICQ